ncbi:MAG: hypothetical protein K0Q60_3291 [Microvirga sp.]|nr:hypothetical protein [Microvirga sp.]
MLEWVDSIWSGGLRLKVSLLWKNYAPLRIQRDDNIIALEVRPASRERFGSDARTAKTHLVVNHFAEVSRALDGTLYGGRVRGIRTAQGNSFWPDADLGLVAGSEALTSAYNFKAALCD